MQARRLPARHGALWLMAGFGLFRANPPLLTMVTMAYLLVVVVISRLPHNVGSFILPVVMPALTLMVANSCRAIEKGGLRPVGHVAQGLREHRDALLLLGGLQWLGSCAILGISTLLGIGTDNIAGAKLDPGQLLEILLPLAAMGLPLLLAFWFAPLLTGWNGVSPLKSVFFSFVAVMRNWRAFLAYGVTIAVAGIVLPGSLIVFAGSVSAPFAKGVATMLQMLFIFVLSPAMMGSIYLSYRDIFVNE